MIIGESIYQWRFLSLIDDIPIGDIPIIPIIIDITIEWWM